MTIDSQLLKTLPLFSSLPDDELRLLAEKLSPVAFADGALVLREGEQCNEFYIVLAGEVDIIKALDTSDQRLLAVRAAGTVVGELSLFSPGGRHTASVLAHGPLQMLAMTRTDFDSLMARQPRLAYGMVQTLSLRLIESEQGTIRDLHAKNDALAQALQSLQAAQAQLVDKEKIERELEVARRIQRSLLPGERPATPGYDFGALMEPMSAVGGDFYDFITFPDGRLGIAVGDVSDHGVPAALFMTMTVTLLRAGARREAAPGDVLRSVNRALLEFNMSGMFVTVLYGVLDPRRREFVYARAGHEQPLLHLAAGPALTGPPRAAEESGMWIVDRSAWATPSSDSAVKHAAGRRRKGAVGTNPLTAAGDPKPLTNDAPAPDTNEAKRETKDEGPLRATVASHSSSFSLQPSSFKRGQALGIVPEPELDEQRLPLPARSTLLLYTDGAREAWDAVGSMFGEQGLRAVLAETETQAAEAVCGRIFERLAAYRGAMPQQDDITLVAVRG